MYETMRHNAIKLNAEVSAVLCSEWSKYCPIQCTRFPGNFIGAEYIPLSLVSTPLCFLNNLHVCLFIIMKIIAQISLKILFFHK